eukprot:2985521-Amphidinium_carterae.1
MRVWAHQKISSDRTKRQRYDMQQTILENYEVCNKRRCKLQFGYTSFRVLWVQLLLHLSGVGFAGAFLQNYVCRGAEMCAAAQEE